MNLTKANDMITLSDEIFINGVPAKRITALRHLTSCQCTADMHDGTLVITDGRL